MTPVGDEALRVVAGILRQEAARLENGPAVRPGGEEFLVLLPDVDRELLLERPVP